MARRQPNIIYILQGLGVLCLLMIMIYPQYGMYLVFGFIGLFLGAPVLGERLWPEETTPKKRRG